MSNTARVIEYLDSVFSRKDLAKAEQISGEDMIQHNPIRADVRPVSPTALQRSS